MCISFRRIGINAGTKSKNIIDKSAQSHYFIKFINNKTINIENLKEIKFYFNNTTGPKSISKQELIKEFNKPITSTSVNITGDRFPECFDEINNDILNQIDYTVNLKRNEKLKTPSQIIKIVGDSFKILRS